LSRPFSPRPSNPASFIRVNGKIRAREVRVIGQDKSQVGVMSLGEAINLARAQGVDLVEIAPNANPPVCRLVDFGKYRYELAKQEKEAKKHQHANKVKEIQLSPKIDPHDLGVKVSHAVDFLCEEIKVKVTLRFRGRELAHKEYGFQIVEKFIKEISPYGVQDAPAKLIGKGINVMLSPLPRNKRAKNPREGAVHLTDEDETDSSPKKSNAAEPNNGSPAQAGTDEAGQSEHFADSAFNNQDVNAEKA
jgi:translation initiation factor IF-3